MLEGHLGELCPIPLFARGFLERSEVNELVVLVERENTMGGEAFDRKGPGDTDFVLVLVRFVVKVFKVGFRRDRSVDFPRLSASR